MTACPLAELCAGSCSTFSCWTPRPAAHSPPTISFISSRTTSARSLSHSRCIPTGMGCRHLGTQELLSPAPKGMTTAIWPALSMKCMQAPCRPPTHLVHPDAPQQRVLQQRKAQAQHLAVVHISIRLKHLQRAMAGRGCHGWHRKRGTQQTVLLRRDPSCPAWLAALEWSPCAIWAPPVQLRPPAPPHMQACTQVLLQQGQQVGQQQHIAVVVLLHTVHCGRQAKQNSRIAEGW